MSVTADDEILPTYQLVFLTALATILFLVCTLGGWGMYARLDGAVVTQGVVLAESKRKTVENLEGGILTRLLVAPGERVRAGQPVAQLDTTQEQERLAQMEAERLALVFDIWRLEAEARETGTLRDLVPPGAGGIDEQRRGDCALVGVDGPPVSRGRRGAQRHVGAVHGDLGQWRDAERGPRRDPRAGPGRHDDATTDPDPDGRDGFGVGDGECGEPG